MLTMPLVCIDSLRNTRRSLPSHFGHQAKRIWPRTTTKKDTSLENTRWEGIGNQLYVHKIILQAFDPWTKLEDLTQDDYNYRYRFRGYKVRGNGKSAIFSSNLFPRLLTREPLLAPAACFLTATWANMSSLASTSSWTRSGAGSQAQSNVNPMAMTMAMATTAMVALPVSEGTSTPKLPGRLGRRTFGLIAMAGPLSLKMSHSVMGMLQERGRQGGSWGRNHLLPSFKSNPHIILSIPGKIWNVLSAGRNKFQGERNQLEEDVGFHSPLVAIQVNLF